MDDGSLDGELTPADDSGGGGPTGTASAPVVARPTPQGVKDDLDGMVWAAVDAAQDLLVGGGPGSR